MEPNLILIGLLLAVKVATGIWLRLAGRPINTLLLTVHKLIALGLLAVLILAARPFFSGASPQLAALAAAAGLFYLASIVTGGLVSLAKPAGQLVKITHLVSPLLFFATAGLLIYLLVG